MVSAVQQLGSQESGHNLDPRRTAMYSADGKAAGP